jgi:2-desacetyl-2-hydroxyethyl bacteriochlorophyllide A dehydrogenase
MNLVKNPTIIFERPKMVGILDREKPRAAAGEILIETSVTLISTGTELTILSGDFPPQSVWSRYGTYPFVAGYSNVGSVAEVGNGVDREWLGRRVVTQTPHAAWVTSPASAAAVIPDEIPDDRAAFFALGGIVMNALRRAELVWGESAVVFGLGLLGQLAVRLAALAGVSRIFAVDISDQRLGLVPQTPPIKCLNPLLDPVPAAIRKLNRGRLADVAFEATGDPALIPSEITALRRQGRFVMLSSPRGKTSFDFHDLCNAPSYTIIGAHNTSHPEHPSADYVWNRIRHYELFFDCMADGKLEIDSLISHRIPYRSAPEVYAQLLVDRSSYMGVILDWRDK